MPSHKLGKNSQIWVGGYVAHSLATPTQTGLKERQERSLRKKTLLILSCTFLP